MVLSYVNVNPEPAAVPDRTPGARIPQCRSRCPGQSCARQLNYSGRHHGRQERALRRHHPSGRVPRYDESTRQQGGPRRPCRATDERSHQVDVTEKARADDHDDNGAEARWLMLNMSSPSLRWYGPCDGDGGREEVVRVMAYDYSTPRRGRLSTRPAPLFT